jgi:hypothetical protein
MAGLWIVTFVAVVQAFNGAPVWVPIVWGLLALIVGFIRQTVGPRKPPLSLFMAKATTATEAEDFITRGARVNDVFPGGDRPLHEATMWGHKGVVKVLLKHGAQLDPKNENGWTPLHVAANNDYAKIVRLLIDYGADANAQARDLRTPLHIAVGTIRLDAAKQLLESGADPNLRDAHGNTPFDTLREARRSWERMPLGQDSPSDRRDLMARIDALARTLERS